MDLKSKIILIYGPTASGKSQFAVKLAKKINGEIINADSMQVYKQLKILSARPSQKEYQKVKHHLYGFQNVTKNFSTGEWLELTDKKILNIKKKKKVPILVGGTGLYFKALTDGLIKIPHIPIKFRSKIRSLHIKLGSKKFFLKLKKLDPLISDKIEPSDTQRAIRAYEVVSFTGKSIYSWFKDTKSKYFEKDFYKIYINTPRKKLLDRINLRTKEMLKKGMILEVKKFNFLKVRKDKSANKAIGVKEVNEYIDKKIEFEELVEKISIKTRQYAKRQTTWGRGNMQNWKKFDSKSLNKFLKKI